MKAASDHCDGSKVKTHPSNAKRNPDPLPDLHAPGGTLGDAHGEAARAPACQYAISWTNPVEGASLRCTEFRHGARISYGVTPGRFQPSEVRGKVLGMSLKSRLRAAWAFGQAECDWAGMITLTWRELPDPADVKRHLRNFSKWVKRQGHRFDGWILEFQRRGAPHFHIFIARGSSLWRALGPGRETFIRHGKPTKIVRGLLERQLAERWIEITGQRDPASVAFHHGGIIEEFRSPDAAGRYVAKEAAKRHQKELPEAYSAGVGRWWYLARQHAPRPRGDYLVPSNMIPENLRVSRIFSRRLLPGIWPGGRSLLFGESRQLDPVEARKLSRRYRSQKRRILHRISDPSREVRKMPLRI